MPGLVPQLHPRRWHATHMYSIPYVILQNVGVLRHLARGTVHVLILHKKRPKPENKWHHTSIREPGRRHRCLWLNRYVNWHRRFNIRLMQARFQLPPSLGTAIGGPELARDIRLPLYRSSMLS